MSEIFWSLYRAMEHRRVSMHVMRHYCKGELAFVLKEYPEDPSQFVTLFKTTVNGKLRQIVTYQTNEKGLALRQLHRMFSMMLTTVFFSASNSYAYKKSFSVNKCLENHLKSDTFLKTDIHAYFDSIPYDRLLDRLLALRPSLKNNPKLWKNILACCFYEGRLPIGFVSSPVLSDLYLHDLDMLFKEKKSIHYTRYADDIIISSSGKKAEERLQKTLDIIRAETGKIGLELNKRKTYIRTLCQEGDAIHLLGLNLVRTAKGGNRITVSQKYLVQTSKAFATLLDCASSLEAWELRREYARVAGRIAYVRSASADSAEKLKKIIRIKTGINTDLTSQSLASLFPEAPGLLKEYGAKKTIDYCNNKKPLRYIPWNGRIWERVTIRPDQKEERGTLNYYLNAICREFEAGEPCRLTVSRMTLQVGDKAYDFAASKDTNTFREMIRKIQDSGSEVIYSADYVYNNSLHPRKSKQEKQVKNGNGRIPQGGYRPFLMYYRMPGSCTVYDLQKHNWFFTREQEDGVLRHDQKLLEKSDIFILDTQSSWEGTLSFTLRWPLHMEETLQSQIGTLVSELKELLKENIQQTDQRRTITGSLQFTMDSAPLTHIVSHLQDLSSLIKQADGEAFINGWCIPHGFLQTTQETVLDYVDFSSYLNKFYIRHLQI